MKTFREFMIIAEAVEDIFGTEEERKRVAERDAAQARRRAARTGVSPEVEAAENKRKAFERSGLSPEEARRRAYRNVKVSGQDIRSGSQTRTQTSPKQPTGTSQTPPRSAQTPPRSTQTRTQTPHRQPSGSAQTPPRGAQTGTQTPPRSTQTRTQTPPRSTQASSGSTPPPRNTQASSAPPRSSSGLSTAVKPPATPQPKGPGLRTRLGRLAGPAATVAGGAMEYKARRDEGQSRARAAGGALASGAGWTKGASLGFRMTPGPLPVKVAGAAVGGLVGDTAASAAYDWAANKSRPARQSAAKATGFDKFQQKNELIKNAKPGDSWQALGRAQQTIDTRGAREVAARSGAYGTKQGSALTGIGGKTTTSKDAKGNAFMSTGAGSQRQTVQLAKTQLVRDPKSGKQVVGDLAFKGGKPVYLARPSVSSRETHLAARVGRALNIGRFSKAAEQQAAQQEYRTALKNTQTYQKKLGITPKAAAAQKLPGQGVGPKKVGPAKVGPKIVGPKLVGPKK